jgi:hypothetical protein
MDITVSRTVVTLQWKVAIRAAGQMARFDLLSISFLSSHFLMPNYDNNNNNNNKLMERDHTCLTWHGDREISAKRYICIYGNKNPHMRNYDNSKLMERERTSPHCLTWHGMVVEKFLQKVYICGHNNPCEKSFMYVLTSSVVAAGN